MLKNADNKIGFKRIPSKRGVSGRTGPNTKENRAPNFVTEIRNRSLKMKNRSKLESLSTLQVFEHTNKPLKRDAYGRKTPGAFHSRRSMKGTARLNGWGRDFDGQVSHLSNFGNMNEMKSGQLSRDRKRGHLGLGMKKGRRAGYAKGSLGKEDSHKRAVLGKTDHWMADKTDKGAVNSNCESIYENGSQIGKQFEYRPFHFKTVGLDIKEGLYNKADKDLKRIKPELKKNESNFRTMKQVLNTQKDSCLKNKHLNIQPGKFQHSKLGKVLIAKDLKKLKRNSLKTSINKPKNNLEEEHKGYTIENLYSKDEQRKGSKRGKRKLMRSEEDGNRRAKGKSQLKDFFQNLEVKSGKRGQVRQSSKIVNQIGRAMKQSRKNLHQGINSRKNSNKKRNSRNSMQLEVLASLMKNSSKEVVSMEKLMLQSRKDLQGKSTNDKAKGVCNIFETIYKEKVRPDSKNNNRRRKSRRTSGLISNSEKENEAVWNNDSARITDSELGKGRISKRIPKNKMFCKRKLLKVKSSWRNSEYDNLEPTGLRKLNSQGLLEEVNVLEVENLLSLREMGGKQSEGLDIEQSLYCKENLKKMGSNQEFNVPGKKDSCGNSKNPSTRETKTLKNARSIGELQREKQVKTGVHINSFFKGSQPRIESDYNVPESKTIKEETPGTRKQLVTKEQLLMDKSGLSLEGERNTEDGNRDRQKLEIESCRKIENDKLEEESPGKLLEESLKIKSCSEFIRENNFKDILSHHIENIMEHMNATEKKCCITEDYFRKKQKQVDNKMREVLVDWLIEVHNRYKMRDETIFMAIKLIDKYLSLEAIEYNKFQLLGTSSLMIAAKYEEIYPPKVKDFVYICANAYTRQDVLDMEAKILRLMKFELVFPTSVQFFGFLQKVYRFDKMVKALVHYILYGTLIFNCFVQSNPRMLVYSAVIMANKAFKNYDEIQRFKEQRGEEFKDSDVNYCIFQIYNMLLTLKKTELTALRTRFSTEKYSNIAKIEGRVH